LRAVDTNVLVYAHRREAREHAAAFERVAQLASNPAPWAIPWPCIYEFFSVVTNPRIWKNKVSTPEQAWSQIEAWTAAPGLRLLGETPEFITSLERLVKRARVRGPVVHDARVAALCLAHGVEVLLSRDRDFSLFPELEIEDPFR
jgi:toxin-antitoxin system PIN domain toxin